MMIVLSTFPNIMMTIQPALIPMQHEIAHNIVPGVRTQQLVHYQMRNKSIFVKNILSKLPLTKTNCAKNFIILYLHQKCF